MSLDPRLRAECLIGGEVDSSGSPTSDLRSSSAFTARRFSAGSLGIFGACSHQTLRETCCDRQLSQQCERRAAIPAESETRRQDRYQESGTRRPGTAVITNTRKVEQMSVIARLTRYGPTFGGVFCTSGRIAIGASVDAIAPQMTEGGACCRPQRRSSGRLVGEGSKGPLELGFRNLEV